MARGARTYRKVEPAMWHADSFRRLSAPPPNAQTLWTYLLTGPRTIAIPGVIVARPAVMADDLRWSRRGFDRAMAEIVAAGMAEIDQEVGLIVLANALIHDGQPRNTARPNGGNAIKSWCQSLLSVPACALRDVLAARLATFASLCGEEIAKAFAESMGRPCTRPSVDHPTTIPDGVGTQDQEQKQDQDQEQKKEGARPPAAPTLSLLPAEPPAAKPDPIADLWAEQERLRAEVIPTSRPLKFAADRRRKIAALLKAGYSLDDLRACLASYAAEARSNGGEWFNGDSNWVAANVARTLGRIGTTTRATVHAPASSIDATAQALRERGFIS
jgi:hypothetical protein